MDKKNINNKMFNILLYISNTASLNPRNTPYQ